MDYNYNIKNIPKNEKEDLYNYFKQFENYDFDENLEKDMLLFFDDEINYCKRRLEKATTWKDFLTYKLKRLEELRFRLQFRIDYLSLHNK